MIAPAGLGACWDAIKAKPDAWSPLWRDLTMPQRRALLTVAGLPLNLAWSKWAELTTTSRETIKAHAGRMLRVLSACVPKEGGAA
jgi:hypothetical protein